jgi:IS5 family transposase
VPDAPTLIRRAGLIQPATLQPLLDHVTDLARELKVTGGRKLRIDGTVVERHIPHPSDSTLLNDGVRVLARVMRKARAPGCCGTRWAGVRPGWRMLPRQARAGIKRMMDVARKTGDAATDALKTAYQELLVVSQSVVAQAQQTAQALTSAANATAQRCGDQPATMVPRVAQVIEQTTRRVRHGETVPAPEKVVSLFEPRRSCAKASPASRASLGGCSGWRRSGAASSPALGCSRAILTRPPRWCRA